MRTAGRSPASYRAAEPTRKTTSTPHIGRRSRPEKQRARCLTSGGRAEANKSRIAAAAEFAGRQQRWTPNEQRWTPDEQRWTPNEQRWTQDSRVAANTAALQ